MPVSSAAPARRPFGTLAPTARQRQDARPHPGHRPASTRPTPALPTPDRRPGQDRRGERGGQAPRSPAGGPPAAGKPEHPILFQQFFKSVGPRTYAAQVKQAGNGNHYLVLTEGKRDETSGDVRKARLFVFSEDFDAFFDLLQQASAFVRAHPVPPHVRRKRERFWAKRPADAIAPPPPGRPRR